MTPPLKPELSSKVQPLTASYSRWYVSAMERLVKVVHELSHARDLNAVMAIVREAARNLTGADGATFVLREGNQCYYAEENAISPLWKGKRFSMETCISGWVMLHKQATTIEDIYSDPRIPAEAYRPTFVKSLAMVPIRSKSPIGAIGNYWAQHRQVTQEELAVLQALADTTSVALENVQLYEELQAQLNALKESNYELSRFAWLASHDLQEPLRGIITQVEQVAQNTQGKLDPHISDHIKIAVINARRLQNLIDDMMVHASAEKSEKFRPTSVEKSLEQAKANINLSIRESDTAIHCPDPLPWIWGDHAMLTRLFQNLLSNAIKFRTDGTQPDIHIYCIQRDNMWVISVRDNGIGIDPVHHQSIFDVFQRLHAQNIYSGSGIGLATCKKIVEMHGGRIWVASTPQRGSTFSFTLPVMQ